MAERFSVPQERVSKELDGEGYRSLCPGLPWGNIPAPLTWTAPGYHFTQRDLPMQQSYFCRTRRLTPPCRAQGSWEAMGMSSAPGGGRGWGEHRCQMSCVVQVSVRTLGT